MGLLKGVQQFGRARVASSALGMPKGPGEGYELPAMPRLMNASPYNWRRAQPRRFEQA
jgi:hypothetical protein